MFPAGWIVVVDGPGRGASFTLQVGVSQIGRGEEQAVRLDFGDTSISRNNHAAVAYDDEQGKFFLGHGGKSNLVRLNGMPVLSTEELTDGDEIRIGETTLKFVALCGEAFTWSTEGGDASRRMNGVPDIRYDVASVLNRGHRDYQEDAIATDFPLGEEFGYAVLSEGMGGHAAGRCGVERSS